MVVSTVTKIRAQLLRTEFGHSLASAANKCSVSKTSVFNWTKEQKQKSGAKRGPRGFHGEIGETISRTVAKQPLTTASILQEAVLTELGMSVSKSTIYKSLKLLRISHKTASRSHDHQAVDKTHPFFGLDPYTEDTIMFDESAFYMNDRPRKGWSTKGTRVPKAKPSPRRRLSLLLATDKRGIVSKRILAGGVKGDHVAEFLERLPDGRPLILDNASVHKTHVVRNICKAKGINLRYIPPYSPWYNPVENAFAQAKHAFRRLRLSETSDLESDIEACLLKIRNYPGMFERSKALFVRRSEP